MQHTDTDHRSDAPLNGVERTLLLATAEALVEIRRLASKPLTKDTQQAIRELADAFHNVPRVAAYTMEEREPLAFLMQAAEQQARMAFERYGVASGVLVGSPATE
ncbi:hypothetical protein BVER_03856c [Candidatus Burkholderia verschuerenii]|uniref:Uncharacterized protein n=1 Tax=Candidatus Burkholderia verschuerenii TaxID=242163 RepID=A0A0L0MCG7_9BURK|nr:hypothetical protein [Candidatus Burkholderia verschuerenii]KND60407.1 hypothetical protein BVER_03856c [Candidatus Burkholderia verschuerenii]